MTVYFHLNSQILLCHQTSDNSFAVKEKTYAACSIPRGSGHFPFRLMEGRADGELCPTLMPIFRHVWPLHSGPLCTHPPLLLYVPSMGFVSVFMASGVGVFCVR